MAAIAAAEVTKPTAVTIGIWGTVNGGTCQDALDKIGNSRVFHGSKVIVDKNEVYVI